MDTGVPAQTTDGKFGGESTGEGSTFTMSASVASQPLAATTVTLYIPWLETLVVCVMSPLLQRYEAYPGPASNVTLAPSHTCTSAPTVNTGGVDVHVLQICPPSSLIGLRVPPICRPFMMPVFCPLQYTLFPNAVIEA